MPRRDEVDPEEPQRRRRPATTPEGRENQLIALAVDLAEKRLMAGTASAAEVVHLLKLGSSREKLEQEKFQLENELTKVKIEALASAKRIEELYVDAIDAMKKYQGVDTGPEEESYED